MWKWVYFNSPTIQATCAVVGLLVLAIYAWDTRRIRVSTLAQSDASRRPFFNIFYAPDTSTWRIVNSGVGVALDVVWNYRIDSPFPRDSPRVGAIAPTGHRALRTKDGLAVTTDQLVKLRGLKVNYADTAGKLYWTTLGFQQLADGSTPIAVDTGEGSGPVLQ